MEGNSVGGGFMADIIMTFMMKDSDDEWLSW